VSERATYELVKHLVGQNTHIIRVLERMESNMANKADLDASVAALKTALEALIAKANSASVPDAALDEVKTAIDALTAEANTAATA